MEIKELKLKNRKKVNIAALAAMCALLAVSAAVSMMVGRYSISFGDIIRILS